MSGATTERPTAQLEPVRAAQPDLVQPAMLQQLYLSAVKIRVESRRERIVEGPFSSASAAGLQDLGGLFSCVPFFSVSRSVRLLGVRGSAESMESDGQSLFALHSGFGFGSRIDHASHTPRCRHRSRFVALRATTALRGFFINDFFWFGPWKCGQSFRRFRPCLGPGLDCPHSHSPIQLRRSGRGSSSGLRCP